MEGTSGDAPMNPQGQNLSDIQSYLANFNKEIEGAPHVPIQATDIPADEQTLVAAQESTSIQSDGNSPTAQFDNVYYGGQLLPGDDQHDPENEDDSPVIPIQGFVVASAADPDDESDTSVSQPGIIKPDPEPLVENQDAATTAETTTMSILDAAQQLSVVHAQIAELSGATEMQAAGNFQDVENPDVHDEMQLQEVIQHVQVSMPESEVVTTTATSTTNMVAMESAEHDSMEMVTVSEDGSIQRVAMDSSSIVAISGTQGDQDIVVGENVHVAVEEEQPVEHFQHVLQQQGHTIDGSDPVAVLASVAANTSSALSHLQGVHVSGCPSEIHGAQLVALQSASDSSQPQLVAVQTPDGIGTEMVQVMGAADAAALGNGQVILNSCGTHFQTVTIMPSEVNQVGEVSYVLIVSQPDGERDGIPRNASDMSIYDFRDDPNREVIEEIIDENGTPRKIIRVRRADHGSPGSELMCNYCNYTSPKRYLLTRHMKSHSDERPHKCGICSRGFKTVASLANHVNTHTGTRPHKCKQCESSFTTSGELVRHIRYRHTFEKPHKCTECDYASVELSKLKRHMRSHTGERPYQCSHCAYASPDTYKLKRHMRIHTGEKPYECDICHAHFTQSNSLKAHRLIHSCNKPIFQCELCPTTCGRKTDLKIHMLKLHTADQPLECKKCCQEFTDRYSYKVHLRSHEGEKCFKCEQCDYAALSQRHLDSHMLTHTGEKPYECNECGQTFRQKQLLRRHKNLYHTPDYTPSLPKDKAFDCSDCDKSYAHRGNLSRHMALHDDPTYQPRGDLSSTELLQRNIIAEIQTGRLTNPAGKAPQVVIVHLDGRVEEVDASGVTRQQQTTDAMVELAMQTMQNRITDAVAQTSTDDGATPGEKAVIQADAVDAEQAPGMSGDAAAVMTAAVTHVPMSSAKAAPQVTTPTTVIQESDTVTAAQASTDAIAQTNVSDVQQEGIHVQVQPQASTSTQSDIVTLVDTHTVTTATLASCEAVQMDGITDQMNLTHDPIVTTASVVTERTPAFITPATNMVTERTPAFTTPVTNSTLPHLSDEMHDAGTQVAFESDSEDDTVTVVEQEEDNDGFRLIITRVETEKNSTRNEQASCCQDSPKHASPNVVSVRLAEEEEETEQGLVLAAHDNFQLTADVGIGSGETTTPSQGTIDEGSSPPEESNDQSPTDVASDAGVSKSARALVTEEMESSDKSQEEMVVAPRRRGRPTKRKSVETPSATTTTTTYTPPIASPTLPGRSTRSRTSSSESTPQKTSSSTTQKRGGPTKEMNGKSTPQKDGSKRELRTRKRRPEVEEFLDSKRSRRSDVSGKGGLAGKK